jgi:hypothetical protein
MAEYLVGGVIQFRRPITRTNPDRVINAYEKGTIIEIALDGSFTIQLLVDEPPVSGILEADIEPSILQPVDSLPGENEEPEVKSPTLTANNERNGKE